MRETFSWLPKYSVALSEEPSVQRTAFGDGYELRVVNGINSTASKWELRFIDTPSKEVLAFLRARGGSEAFDWTDPLGTDGVYVCRSWKPMHLGRGLYEISATFEQVFEA